MFIDIDSSINVATKTATTTITTPTRVAATAAAVVKVVVAAARIYTHLLSLSISLSLRLSISNASFSTSVNRVKKIVHTKFYRRMKINKGTSIEPTHWRWRRNNTTTVLKVLNICARSQVQQAKTHRERERKKGRRDWALQTKRRKICRGNAEKHFQSEKWCSSLKLLNFMKLFIVGKFVEKIVNTAMHHQCFPFAGTTTIFG